MGAKRPILAPLQSCYENDMVAVEGLVWWSQPLYIHLPPYLRHRFQHGLETVSS